MELCWVEGLEGVAGDIGEGGVEIERRGVRGDAVLWLGWGGGLEVVGRWDGVVVLWRVEVWRGCDMCFGRDHEHEERGEEGLRGRGDETGASRVSTMSDMGW